ncbi:MAG: DNA alkylation repair protein [bacterium]|nr:DNA alkylation repair protein [bacterium]
MKRELSLYATPERAESNRRFFKTAPGQYGEGDRFIGVTVPDTRTVARRYGQAPLTETKKLLASKIHEERLLALLIWRIQYEQGGEDRRERLFQAFVSNLHHINNWDLVDSSAPFVPGPHLFQRDRSLLFEWARSPVLWERRIAIIAPFYFIHQDDFEDALRIADILLNDEEDLIHKAVGWMLREIGKRDLHTEEEFLKPRYQTMPRTMLRYAIEKFPEAKRNKYLTGKI